MKLVALTRITSSDRREVVWVNPERIAFVGPAWGTKDTYVVFDDDLCIHVEHSPEQVLRRMQDTPSVENLPLEVAV